jgi:hypothetical protein
MNINTEFCNMLILNLSYFINLILIYSLPIIQIYYALTYFNDLNYEIYFWILTNGIITFICYMIPILLYLFIISIHNLTRHPNIKTIKLYVNLINIIQTTNITWICIGIYLLLNNMENTKTNCLMILSLTTTLNQILYQTIKNYDGVIDTNMNYFK